MFPETKDLPKGFDFRKSLITVSSCNKHNSHKSSEDEYLLYCLVMSIPSYTVGKNHFYSKVFHAIKRNPSLFKKHLNETVNLGVENVETKEFGTKIDNDRLDKSLEQISKALYFHHFQKKRLVDVKIYPNSLLSMGCVQIQNSRVIK